ncbi:Flp family type IVb pilin [Rhodobacteraceae bacterium W635]|nr:Flp family type IVb pilin [Rhodobacteraceae bacterium W635]
MQFLHTLKKNDSGATAIEYGLIAALVSVAIIGALTTLGTDLGGIFGDVSTELQDAGEDG